MAPRDEGGRAPDEHPTTQTIVNYPSGVTSADAHDTCTGLKLQPDDAWRTLPAHPGYECTADGRIRSTDRVIVDRNGMVKRLKGRELVVADGGVSLSTGGRRRSYWVSTLVRATWGGEPR